MTRVGTRNGPGPASGSRSASSSCRSDKKEPRRVRFFKVYTYIIKKPIEDAGFECERGDQLPEFGPIPEQIIKKLKNADLVVADLSGRNPNVFYEPLGHRPRLESTRDPHQR